MTYTHLVLRLFLVLAFAATAAFCQDVQSILTKMAQRYATLDGYHVEGVYEVNQTQGSNSGHNSAKFKLDAADKTHKVHVFCAPGDLACELISNGATTWTYLPSKSTYTQVDAIASDSGGADANPTNTEDADDLASQYRNIVIARYAALQPPYNAWKLSGEKQVKTEHGKIPCYVIERKVANGTEKLWIAQEQSLVLRSETSITQNGMLISATLIIKQFTTQMPSDASFTFVPPAKARRVDDLPIPGFTPSFIGRPAADFSLKDLNGNVVRLSDLRGKIVVLDFWATWCPPCRHELPTIDKLAVELKSKDVVVLGLNDEGASTVKSFNKKNDYTFTTLEDSGRKISRAYHASAIPNVFVIGRDGLIVRRFVGSREKPELMAALRDAGLK